MNKHIKIITIQAIFLVVILIIIYLLYPKIELNVNENLVNFKSINADVIIISENPDFSNSRFIELEKNKSISFGLEPGTYYWKSSNNLIEGIKHEFTISSEVGIEIKKEAEDNNSLINVGNVKINVTKSKSGMMIGYITLEPNESEKIEDSGEYTGRQA